MTRPSTANSAMSGSSGEYESTWPASPASTEYYRLKGSQPRECHKLAGARKIHYQPHSDWDYVASAEPAEPVDVDLILPHYRAHTQPLNHRMSMYIRGKGEIKAKVCRRTRSPFFLRVDSDSPAPVTIYLPSDFTGTIRFPVRAPRLALSAGFTNTIRPRAHFSPNAHSAAVNAGEMTSGSDDEVEIYAAGPVVLRMWDVLEGAPESAAREAWRKLCRRASSKNLRAGADKRSADWDFLLDD